MKPAYSIIIIAFIITIAEIFYNNIFLNITAGMLLLIAIFLSVKILHKAETRRNNENRLSLEKIKEERNKYKKEIEHSKEKNAEIMDKYEISINMKDTMNRLLTELDITTPIIEKLSIVIIDKSEESTLNATEKIFTIVGESQEVSNDIQILLADMSKGDHSLEQEIDKLLAEVEDFEVIVVKVEKLKTSYEIRKKFISLKQKYGLQERDDIGVISTDLLANASKVFTVREEWIALDLELNESQLKKTDGKENLHGDITLF